MKYGIIASLALGISMTVVVLVTFVYAIQQPLRKLLVVVEEYMVIPELILIIAALALQVYCIMKIIIREE